MLGLCHIISTYYVLRLLGLKVGSFGICFVPGAPGLVAAVHAPRAVPQQHSLRAAAAGPRDSWCPRGVRIAIAKSICSGACSWAHAAQAVAHQQCQSWACHQICHGHAGRCSAGSVLGSSQAVGHGRGYLPLGRIDYHGAHAQVCADTLIGSQLVRGISGGQKKRVTTGEIYGTHCILSMLCTTTTCTRIHVSSFNNLSC